jgi:hypothetical protein
MEEAEQSRPKWQCGDWYVSHDHMPPGPATLRVTGKCTFRTGGYKVELRRSDLQGTNPFPGDLLLELVVEEPPPSSIVSQGFTTLEVRYEEETDTEYETVTILSDSVTVPVEDVH